MKSLWAWVLIGCFWIGNVYAADELVYESNVTITRIGAHPGNTFYVSLAEGFKKPCKYGLAYCSATEPSCQSMLSIALTAKTTGVKIPDFRYQFNAQTQMCMIWLVSE